MKKKTLAILLSALMIGSALAGAAAATALQTPRTAPTAAATLRRQRSPI